MAVTKAMLMAALAAFATIGLAFPAQGRRVKDVPTSSVNARELRSDVYIKTPTTCMWDCKGDNACKYYVKNEYQLTNMDYMKATFQATTAAVFWKTSVNYTAEGPIDLTIDVAPSVVKSTLFIAFQGVDKEENVYYFTAMSCQQLPRPPPPSPPPSPPPPTPADIQGTYFVDGIHDAKETNGTRIVGWNTLHFSLTTPSDLSHKVSLRYTFANGTEFLSYSVYRQAYTNHFDFETDIDWHYTPDLVHHGATIEARTYLKSQGDKPSNWVIVPRVGMH